MNLALRPGTAGPAAARFDTRRCLILVLALAIALPLAACGKKGDPQAPPNQKKVYPRTYPYDPTARPPDADEQPQ
jgi:predicted small lipoprotein YifL